MHQTLSVNRAGAMFDVCEPGLWGRTGPLLLMLYHMAFCGTTKSTRTLYPVLKNVSEILLAYVPLDCYFNFIN